MSIDVLRGGERKTIEVKLGERRPNAGAVSFQAPAVSCSACRWSPLLAVAYAARAGRRRRRAAAAWAAPADAGRRSRRGRPGWRRHVPMALFGLALAVLVVALARPQASVAVEVERASVVLVTDRSGSMEATDVPPSRLRAALAAADTFLRRVPKQVRVGAVAFNQHAATLQRPTTDRAGRAREARRARSRSGGTATGDALDGRAARDPRSSRVGRQAAAGGDRADLRRRVGPRARPGRRWPRRPGG